MIELVATSIVVIIVVAIILLLIPWVAKLYGFKKEMRIYSMLPGPPEASFLLGHAPMLERDACLFYRQILDYCQTFQKEGLLRIRIGLYRVVVFFKPECAEKILTGTKHINKATFYHTLHSWLGRGLLTADADKWRPRRKLLTHAFHFKILQDFVPLLNEHAATLLEILEENRQKQLSIDCKETKRKGTSIYPLITRCALDIICDSAMGVNINAQRDPQCSYVQAILTLSDIVMARMKNPFYIYDKIFRFFPEGRKYNKLVNEVHAFTESVIRRRKQLRHENKNKTSSDKTNEEFVEQVPEQTHSRRLAFLDLLLSYQEEQQQAVIGQNGAGTSGDLTDQDIREEVDTFMFEGHDTTSSGMTWTLYLLATHPHVQKKLQEELDSILNIDDTMISLDHVGQMHYLEMVIKESLRLFPPVPVIGRMCEDDIDVNGYRVSKGVEILLVITALHRQEELFQRANEFLPERFDKTDPLSQTPLSQASNVSPFNYVPFSAGARNCIGSKFAQLEEKVIIASILRKYSISCNQTVEEIAPRMDIILRPGNDIFLNFYPRDDENS